MSCCSTHTAEDKLEPYQLRAVYIRQISRLAQTGIFGQALNVFKEVRVGIIKLTSSWEVTTRKKTTLVSSTELFNDLFCLAAMEFATSESFKTQMEFSACLNLHGYMFQKEVQELQTCYDCYFYIVLMKKLYRSEGKLNQGRSTGVN